MAYSFLPLSVVEKFVPLAASRGVSKVARSPRGFLSAYRRAGSAAALPPEWRQKRDGFIARHMKQVEMRREPLWKDGEPTRRHLALIMWAYSPDAAVKRNNPGFRYPLAHRDEWYSDCDYEACGARLVWMSPQDFLDRVRPLEADTVALENIVNLAAHIEDGGALDPLAIYSDEIEDGRHRAHAAIRCGIAEVPVLVFPRANPVKVGEHPDMFDGETAIFSDWREVDRDKLLKLMPEDFSGDDLEEMATEDEALYDTIWANEEEAQQERIKPLVEYIRNVAEREYEWQRSSDAAESEFDFFLTLLSGNEIDIGHLINEISPSIPEIENYNEAELEAVLFDPANYRITTEQPDGPVVWDYERDTALEGLQEEEDFVAAKKELEKEEPWIYWKARDIQRAMDHATWLNFSADIHYKGYQALQEWRAQQKRKNPHRIAVSREIRDEADAAYEQPWGGRWDCPV